MNRSITCSGSMREKPSSSYIFPTLFLGGCNRAFKPKWFDEHGCWLVYSPKLNRAFCVCCALVHQTHWEEANKLEHKAAVQDAELFIWSVENPDHNSSDDRQPEGSQHQREQAHLKKSVAEVILYCGRHCIALRGDNKNANKGKATKKESEDQFTKSGNETHSTPKIQPSGKFWQLFNLDEVCSRPWQAAEKCTWRHPSCRMPPLSHSRPRMRWLMSLEIASCRPKLWKRSRMHRSIPPWLMRSLPTMWSWYHCASDLLTRITTSGRNCWRSVSPSHYAKTKHQEVTRWREVSKMLRQTACENEVPASQQCCVCAHGSTADPPVSCICRDCGASYTSCKTCFLIHLTACLTFSIVQTSSRLVFCQCKNYQSVSCHHNDYVMPVLMIMAVYSSIYSNFIKREIPNTGVKCSAAPGEIHIACQQHGTGEKFTLWIEKLNRAA